MQCFQSSGKEWILSTLSGSLRAESSDCKTQKCTVKVLIVRGFVLVVCFKITMTSFKYRQERPEPLVNINMEGTKCQISWWLKLDQRQAQVNPYQIKKHNIVLIPALCQLWADDSISVLHFASREQCIFDLAVKVAGELQLPELQLQKLYRIRE